MLTAHVMHTDQETDAFVARLANSGCQLDATATSWLAAFELALPFRLPPHFQSLIARYSFDPFEWRDVAFFGNRGNRDHTDLVVASTQDPLLTRVTRSQGLLRVGRPASGSYDPVCFDMGRRSKVGDAPLVRIDHEEVLIHSRVRVIHTYATSFREFICAEAA